MLRCANARFPHRTALSRRARCGFSLVEALVAVTVLALASSAILLTSYASANATSDALERTAAAGIADLMIDEILGLPYKEKTDPVADWPLSIEPGEASLPRSLFDDADDYNDYASQPPVDAWGVPLGSGDGQGGRRPEAFRVAPRFFQDWSVVVEVKYLDEADLSKSLPAGEASGFRAVEVSVWRGERDAERLLAKIRRVIGYVPPPPL